MSQRSTRKEQFFPWAFGQLALEVQVIRATLDGEREAAIDPLRHLVELDEEWKHAVLELHGRHPPELLRDLLPPGDDSGVDAVIGLRCQETRWRHGVRVPLGRLTHEWTLSVPLRREDLAGALELDVSLVRASDAASPTSGFAQRAHEGVAGSRPWELRVDRRRSLGGAYLDIRFRSFKEDALIPVREQGNLFRLDLDLEVPILHLNSDHASVVPILNAKGTVGRNARLRDVAYDLVSLTVWLQLFAHAASELKRLGEAGAPWQEAMLDHCARLLFHEAKDTAEARAQLYRSLIDQGDLAELMRRLSDAHQADSNVAKHLLQLIDEAP